MFLKFVGSLETGNRRPKSGDRSIGSSSSFYFIFFVCLPKSMIQATIMLCRSPLGNGLFRLDSTGFSPKILWPSPFISPSRLPTPVSGLPSIRFPSTASSLRKQLLRERASIFRLRSSCSLLLAPFDTLSFDCFANFD